MFKVFPDGTIGIPGCSWCMFCEQYEPAAFDGKHYAYLCTHPKSRGDCAPHLIGFPYWCPILKNPPTLKIMMDQEAIRKYLDDVGYIEEENDQIYAQMGYIEVDLITTESSKKKKENS